MKFILLLSLIVAAIIPENLTAVSQGLQEDPRYPGKCVIDDMILSPGEEASVPGKCEQIICHERSYASFFSCGVVGVPPGFKLSDPIDPDADYPKCCARKIVPKNKKV